VLVEAVLAVAAGKPYIVPAVAQELAMRSLARDGDGAESLSPREFEVLRMLVDGRPVGDIARSLGLTSKTVANHQSALRQKLGAGTAVQLLQAAARLGLVPKAPAA
jgi:DNA-binding NarL/FixJ family response regulator